MKRGLHVVKWLAVAAIVVVFGRDYLRKSSEISRLSASLATMEREPASVVRVIEREVRVAPAPAPVSEPAAKAPEPSRPSSKENERTTEQLNEHVEATYADERIDPAWSTRLDADLRSAAASLGARDNVKSIDCRTTMCRITSRFPNIASYNKFMDEVAGRPSGGDGMFSTEANVGPDGTVRAVSYWIRAGHMKTLVAAAPEEGAR